MCVRSSRILLVELHGTRARDLVWSLVVRSGKISLPRTRPRFRSPSLSRGEEYYRIVLGDLPHISKILCQGTARLSTHRRRQDSVAHRLDHTDVFVWLDIADMLSLRFANKQCC